ncbi:MAG: tetratricopeptide repeat protein [Deltaproteobacteria bacterium]|nr:tetratricopeptide repeat protein [Deltaproteobacteria bacterium]
MSLIHQALKKLEGAKHPAAASEYSFKKPGIRALRPFVLPVLVLLSVISAYFLYTGASKNNIESKVPAVAVQNPSQAGEAAMPMPALQMPADFNSQAMEEYRAGRFEKAAALFAKTAGSMPVSASAFSNQGLAAMRLGKKSEAEAAFKKALELDASHPQALNNYASLMAEAGKTAKAKAMLEKAIKTDPSYADAHFNLAVLLEKKGDLTGALAGYEEFIRLEPSDSAAAQVRRKLMELRSMIIIKQAGGR